ncbi:hypothetical protein [Rhizobium sp. TH135]|uniref:hypothetical protein n=1 Tax=Rhizobium sp. TH135 TaxID=2067451 RepID=UPI001FE109DF|nr:hypothetical protein [Rhizobium sp. TH135]
MLAGEIDLDGLKDAHNCFKSHIGAESIETAKKILGVHNARLRGELDADAAAEYAEGFINE